MMPKASDVEGLTTGLHMVWNLCSLVFTVKNVAMFVSGLQLC